MRKLVLVTLAALFWVAPASAKELLGAQLCGPAGCATERGTSLREGPNGPFSGELAQPAAPSSWYRGYLLAGDQGKVIGKMLFYYVPSAHQVVQPGRYGQTTTWLRAKPDLAAMLERLSDKVKPYPVPRMTAVRVDSKPVADPQSYLRLWTLDKKASGYPDGLGSHTVIFYSEPASPWSDGNYVVAYPKAKLLLRDGNVVALPKALADRLDRRQSLRTSSSRTWMWALVVVPFAALGGGLRLRRHRDH
jgi:hypothetical protein